MTVSLLRPRTQASGTTLLEPPVRRLRGRPRPRGPEEPREPAAGGGGGGGGGDGGGRGDDGRGHGRRWGDDDGAPGPERRPVRTGEFAFAFLLVGISTVFLAFLLAYLLLRRQAGFAPPSLPAPPRGLWASTAVLAASSLTVLRAGRARGRRARRRWLAGSFALGVAFLIVQAALWTELMRAGVTTEGSAYGALFYSLTGLHAIHVVGGLAFMLAVLLRRPPRGADARRAGRTALRLCALYWHFMGAIWVVLFAALYFLD